jgi:hypothetical protein
MGDIDGVTLRFNFLVGNLNPDFARVRIMCSLVGLVIGTSRAGG